MLQKKSLLLIEPVSIHWSYVYPLADHFLHRGWFVTFSGSKELQQAVILRINDNPNIDRLTFKENTFFNISSLLFKKWNAISLTPRILFSKRKKMSLRCLIDAAKQLLYLLFFIKLKNTTVLMAEIHQIDSLKTFPESILFLSAFNRVLFHRLKKRIDLINVMDSPIGKAIMSRGITTPVFVSPFFVFKNQSVAGNSRKVLKIVMTGRIDMTRRDYSWIELIPDSYKKKMLFIFAGRAMSLSDREYIASLRAKNFQIPAETNGDYISEMLFDDFCLSSDIMVGSIKSHFRKGEEERVIGFHSSAGCLNDAMRFGKPLFLPKNLIIGERCKKNVIFYEDNNDLCKLLIKLLEKPEMLNSLQKKAHQNSLRFTREKIDYLDRLTKNGIKL